MRISLIFIAVAVLFGGCAVTTEPLSNQEIEQRVEEDLMAMQADQQPVGDEPITLHEAMARAITYNLDHRLKMMEITLANKNLDVSHYDLLPEITASAGYSARDNDLASYSESMADGSESLTSSTSQEKDNFTADLKVVWNVLDFGVSYLRTKQEADQVLILEERRRKVVQNIIQDVRYAYWRAVCAERLVSQMVDLLDKSKSALKRSREMTREGLAAPKESLEYQRALLENIRMLWEIIQRLSPAKVELASLMNLPPGTTYHLAEPGWDNPEVPGFATRISELEQLALISRPELREEDYNARISALDVRKTMLQMLPGIELQLGYNYDSNKYLYNDDWWNAGAFLSHKLFNLISGPARIDAAEANVDFVDLRRKAVSMAVMLQVRLAHQHYHLVKRQYLVNRNLDEINVQLNDQIIQEKVAGRTDELTAIRSATNAMVARLRHYLAYAEMQNAAGRLYNSLGLDPLSPAIASGNLSLVAEGLDNSFSKWDKLVNYLGEQTAGQEETDDSGIAQILAAFDNELDWPAVSQTRTGVSYKYDWLDGSFVAPEERPVSGQKGTEQTELKDVVVEESLDASVDGADGGTKVAMKGGKVSDRSVLSPVDESLYAPKKISMVARGLQSSTARYYPVDGYSAQAGVPISSKGLGKVAFLPRVLSGPAGATAKTPVAARGYSLEDMEKMAPIDSRTSRQIKLTGADEKE